MTNPLARRAFLGATIGAAAGLGFSAPDGCLEGEIGLTTGSFMKHLADGKFRILDLPKIMRDRLDMRVLDLMTRTLESFEPGDLTNRNYRLLRFTENSRIHRAHFDAIPLPDRTITVHQTPIR